MLKELDELWVYSNVVARECRVAYSHGRRTTIPIRFVPPGAGQDVPPLAGRGAVTPGMMVGNSTKTAVSNHDAASAEPIVFLGLSNQGERKQTIARIKRTLHER